MQPIRNNSCCPAFLIALAGPWICILRAAFVEHVIIQELTDFIWIGGRPHDDGRVKSVARILVALGQGIAELEEFYKNLDLGHSRRDSQRFFPFVRQYSIGERVFVPGLSHSRNLRRSLEVHVLDQYRERRRTTLW